MRDVVSIVYGTAQRPLWASTPALSSRSQWESYLSQVLYRYVDLILVDAVMNTFYLGDIFM